MKGDAGRRRPPNDTPAARWFERTFADDDPELQRHVRLSKYVDGELSDEEAAEVERDLLEHPELQDELEDLVVLAALADQDDEVSAPEATPEAAAETSSRGQPSPAVVSLVEASTPIRSKSTWRRRWGAIWSGGVSAAAAAAVYVLTLPQAIPLQIQVLQNANVALRSAPGGAYGAVQANLGSTLLATAGYAHDRYALRVYPPPGAGPVRTCPGDTKCVTESNKVRLEVELDARGRYQILWIDADEVPPTTGDLDRDLERLDAKAQPKILEVEVR